MATKRNTPAAIEPENVTAAIEPEAITAPAAIEPETVTAAILTDKTRKGDSVSVDPADIERVAASFGAGRTARIRRAYEIGRMVARYSGMSVKRAHEMLIASGHYGVHYDTANNGAHAYAIVSEADPVSLLAITDAIENGGSVDEISEGPAAILADTYSLIDVCKSGKQTRELLGMAEILAVTDPAERAEMLRDRVTEYLAIARTTPEPDENDGESDDDGENGENGESDENGAENGPVSEYVVGDGTAALILAIADGIRRMTPADIENYGESITAAIVGISHAIGTHGIVTESVTA
jgi:hypothetical protein